MTKANSSTYQHLVRIDVILGAAIDRHPRFRKIAGVETASWIRDRMDVKHVGKDVLEIRISGRPAEREQLREVADAVAAEYVDFLRELEYFPSDDVIAKLQKAYDEVKARHDQGAPLPQKGAEDRSSSPKQSDAESERMQQLLQKLASEIQRLKQQQKQNPGPPKVIRSSSGVNW